jgi:hypothetical protein
MKDDQGFIKLEHPRGASTGAPRLTLCPDGLIMGVDNDRPLHSGEGNQDCIYVDDEADWRHFQTFVKGELDCRRFRKSPFIVSEKLNQIDMRQCRKKSPIPLIGKHHNGRITMKRLLLAFITLAVAAAFSAPAFAGILDAKNKAECEKAGGVWIEKDHKCGAKKP